MFRLLSVQSRVQRENIFQARQSTLVSHVNIDFIVFNFLFKTINLIVNFFKAVTVKIQLQMQARAASAHSQFWTQWSLLKAENIMTIVQFAIYAQKSWQVKVSIRTSKRSHIAQNVLPRRKQRFVINAPSQLRQIKPILFLKTRTFIRNVLLVKNVRSRYRAPSRFTVTKSQIRSYAKSALKYIKTRKASLMFFVTSIKVINPVRILK